MLRLLIILALSTFTLTRFALSLYTGTHNVPLSLWPGIFAHGLFYDAATLAYVAGALCFVRALTPNRQVRAFSFLARLGLTVWILFLLMLAAFEITFWIEFSTRFNFIAVDYLIYTQEVVKNIWQSYPILKIFLGMTLVAIAAGVYLYHVFLRHRTMSPLTPRWRLGLACAGLLLPCISFFGVSADGMFRGGNAYAEELSGNGLFTLFAAFRDNDLNYDQLYATIPQDKADRLLRQMNVEWNSNMEHRARDRWGDDHPGDPLPFTFRRHPRNIVLVSVESLSADFVGFHGSTAGLTPRLDQLAQESLVFRRLFATGTRTVRGLEALSLGTPPIPGQAIIRRPKNQDLSTMGEILRPQGFEVFFIYGGYGYFDNMNAYFESNAYTVIDRTDFPAASIPFENAWGVADESLYDNSLNALDAAYAKGKRFYAHIMTTSNHRPYTYPNGRIDIPSPGGRAGAVKYTDYALGRFIDQARQHPWFKDTLFVLTADHCASVAGKTDLPVAKYHIPLLFFAPGMLKPGTVDRMISQIDIPPTLLDILGVAGDDNFFGKEFPEQEGPPRAFISTYQSLGYYKNDQLVVLKPQRRIETYAIDPVTYEARPIPADESLVEEAIAYYQTASRAYKNGQLKLPWR